MKQYEEHPVIVELRSKIDQSRNELLKLLDYWHFMKNILHPQITFTYESIFGDLENELQEKSEMASNLEHKLEILSSKMRQAFNNQHYGNSNRNYYNNGNTSNQNANYDNLDALFNSFDSSGKIPDCDVNTRYELPQIYRQLVKKLHPDVNGHTEEFEKFWDNIQDAYKSQNLHRLRLFYLSLCNDLNNTAPDYKTEEISLRSEIREFERNINIEKKKIEQIKQREPFVFQDKLNDSYWIQSRKKKLNIKFYKLI